jgi:hypothetical protein
VSFTIVLNSWIIAVSRVLWAGFPRTAIVRPTIIVIFAGISSTIPPLSWIGAACRNICTSVSSVIAVIVPAISRLIAGSPIAIKAEVLIWTAFGVAYAMAIGFSWTEVAVAIFIGGTVLVITIVSICRVGAFGWVRVTDWVQTEVVITIIARGACVAFTIPSSSRVITYIRVSFARVVQTKVWITF